MVLRYFVTLQETFNHVTAEENHPHRARKLVELENGLVSHVEGPSNTNES